MPEKQLEFDYESIDPGYYDRAYHAKKGIQSKWHHIKFDSLHKILADISFDRMLDIACGPGTFIGTFKNDDKVFTGIDLSQNQIEYAEANYGSSNKNFIIQDAAKMSFEDDSFDLVSSIEFIEHIEIELFESILAECKRCLKKEGHLLLTTPNYQFGWYAIEALLSKISKVDYTDQHITHFNLQRLTNVLEKNGFEIVLGRKFIYHAPFFAALNWKLAQKVHEIEFKYQNIGYSLVVLAKQK